MTKTFFLAAALLISASSYGATQKIVGDQKFIAAGDGPYSQLCMAALDSKYVLLQKAKALGISKHQLRDVTCNGLTLVRFAREYRGNIQQWFADRN